MPVFLLCVHVCVCIYPPRLAISSGVIWTPYDWLNNFYSFYMAAIVGIVCRCGLTIEVRRRNQTNKSKLELCKPWNHFNDHLNQPYISNKTEHFSYKGGCGIYGCMHVEMFKRKAGLGYR